MSLESDKNDNTNYLSSYYIETSSDIVKSENNKNNLNVPASQELIEKIFSTGDILNLIISNIFTINEKKYIELTCRSFYNACNNFTSKVKKFSLKEGNGHEYVSDRQLIQCLENTIYVNIKEFIELHTHILEGNKFKIKTCAQQKSKLVIKNLNLKYASFFNSIPFFENIKTLIPVLKPTHITFEDYGTRHFVDLYNNNCNNNNIYVNDSILDSVKSLYFMCSRQMIFCLLNLFQKMKEKSFDIITFGSYFTKGFLTNEELEIVSEISNHSKYIKIIVNDDITGNINDYIYKKLENLNLLTNENMEYEFNLYYLTLDLYFAYDNNIEEISNNVKFHKNYLKIYTFRFFQSPDSGIFKISYPYIHCLIESLYYMKNLNTLELELNLINDLKDFENVFKNVSKNVKNIKLYMCQNFNENHLLILSMHVYNLENLQLTNVKSNNITIKLIIKSFKKLKGLSILFILPYNNDNIKDDIIKEEKTTKKQILNWPNLEFLEIYCCVNNEEFIKLFETVEYNTPHQSGKLLLIRNPFEYRNNRFVTMSTASFQIIIQKSSKNYGIFKKIFSAATNMLGNITLYGTF
ncbi:Hypothetical protein SRAE_X000228200 [Strongyloides ratti]|uniref:F-box domain-containing protein n=1 Tax=Strongyloides ratti TaxID=34506 RepID=A0A090KSR5_STRRB|nr:Hypothetical protein SRAE_X000228200 [Strongyloides ratti]CEF60545.1 Hypothetical protein SRAE_X000228200 [Strongyloides ratti]